MDKQELESALEGRHEQLTTLGTEADRQLLDVARRLDNAATRAALIIGSAAIASGVQLSKGFSTFAVLAILTSLVAAALSIPLLIFRPRREVNVRELRDRLSTWSPRRLDAEILGVKLNLIREEEDALRVRSRILLASLVALAVAIALTAVRVFTG